MNGDGTPTVEVAWTIGGELAGYAAQLRSLAGKKVSESLNSAQNCVRGERLAEIVPT